MSCYCSSNAFTCNKSSFSLPLPGNCALHSLTPAVPVHHFQLFCPTDCTPVVIGSSPNHGISCNNYNGYYTPTYILTPGHTPSCPQCMNTLPCKC